METRSFPECTVIIGTDASGKDHVANILVAMIEQAGYRAQKRARLLSGKKTTTEDSSNKGWLDTLQERLFLLLYRRLGFLLPLLATLVIHVDLVRFRQPENSKLVVVGHNCLRALAFHYGHRLGDSPAIPPWYLARALQRMRECASTRYIVLDVDDMVRQKRIAARAARGDIDLFDQYMQRDGALSERIESCLVGLCCNFLGARLITNNDLDNEELQAALMQGYVWEQS